MKPRFSVVIALYNKERFIANTIRSVLAQSFQDFELIIINDGSTDKSLENVQQFSDPRIRIITQKNQGVSTARNNGISVANAHYITFLDADDYWYPDFLQTMNRLIGLYPAEKVFSSAIEHQYGKSIVKAKYSIDKNKDVIVSDYFSASLLETAICTSAAVFHHSVFIDVGTFDERLKSGEDTDLWIRIGLKYKIVFTKKVLARYISAPESLSQTTISNIDLEKYHDLENSNPSLKKFLNLNRYSLALQSKISGDLESYKHFLNNITSLPPKNNVLLLLPRFVLKILITLKKR